MSVCFGDFELDQGRRQLLRSGRPVPLEPKAFELLSLLVERRPRVLSRAQIRAVVWPEVFVSESTLSQAVNAIRQALDDDARRPRFIRTAHGFGYGFCGEARETTDDEPPTAILKEDPPELSGTRRAISPGVADLKRRKHWLLVALAAMVLVAGGVYRSLVRSPAPTGVDVVDSVAVLPFENVGGDPDHEYLSDGIADTLINELSRLPNLRVIARSTSFRFRGSEVDPRKVGRDLGVGAVLTGRVSQRGDTLVIGAELVDVARGTRLWGERYNTRIRDIFAVQEDLSRDISRSLRLKLATRDETLLTRRHTPNPEAYRLCLLSRYELNKPPTSQGVKRALEYAQQATEKDPAYAAAYAALAIAYTMHGGGSLLPPREAYSKAKAAATKALEIDETLSEAHGAIALAVLYLDRDWAGAKSAFERAIELNPNFAAVHRGYGLYLYQVGSSQEGMEHFKRALEIDPLSPRSHVSLFGGYYFGRQFDKALDALRTAIDLDPGFEPLYLAWIYREKGMFEEAIAEFRKAPKENLPSQAHLGNAYARAGRVTEARACLQKLKELFRRDNVGTYGIALVHAGLAEKDQAFEWLEKAYEDGDPGMIYMKIDPALDPLRSDARFEDLLRRMNFPSLIPSGRSHR